LNRLLRAAHIERLVPNIEAMGPGPLFETFGTRFLSRLLDIPLVQRGVSVRGNPIGRTVDATALNDSTVAEFSTDKGYFAGDKPRNDLAHIVYRHPSAKQIYLVSSQVAPAGSIDAFVESNGSQGRSVHVLDARRIAEEIIDRLMASDDAIDDLSEFIPVLAMVRDEHALDLRAPRPGSRHIQRPDVDAAIAEALGRSPCVAISGMGGVGKSEAAAAYVETHRNEYMQTIWLDGAQIERIEDLSAVAIRRAGDALNVVGLLNNRRCLLVIDDAKANLDPAQLSSMCGQGSHIILTRRVAQKSYSLPLLTENESQSLLEADSVDPCPRPIFEKVLATAGGHPLSLALINAAVGNGTSWGDIAIDCEEIGKFTDGDTRLYERILGRLRSNLEGELAVFAWADQPICDTGFLRCAIKPVGVRNLQSNALTAVDRASVIRLHEIVFAALRGGGWCSEARAAELDDALELYIASLTRGDTHNLQTVAGTHRRKLEARVAAGDRRPAYLYALIFAWDAADADVPSLPDPTDLARSLRCASGPARDMQLMLVIEAVEALFRYEREIKGSTEAKRRYRERLSVFDILDDTPDLNPRQRAEIIHHRGKLHRSIGDGDEAAKLFEQVLESEVPLSEAKLQLVRLYSKEPNRNLERAQQLTDELVASIATGGEGLSSSVTLGLIEALHWAREDWSNSIFEANYDLFMAHVSRGLLAGIPQAYETLASIVRNWAWTNPSRLEMLSGLIDTASAYDIREDRGRGAYAEIQQKLAKTRSGEAADKHLKFALQGFEALKRPSAYQRRNHAETLLELGRFLEADTILRNIIDPEGRPFVAFSLSKANLGLGNLKEALAFADEAVVAAEGRNVRFKPSFMEQRAAVRREMDRGTLDGLNGGS
jgi:tetratricopeptide (TPR) repeat protein